MILTFVILAVTIILFISDKFRIDIVALLSLMALFLFGLIDTNQALAGFANSTVVTIAGLFVVGGGLFRTGVADWLADQLLRLAGSNETRLLIMMMVGTAFLSAFLSNTGTVAVLLPAVVAAAWRIGSKPSRLLLPMAFAAQIGGLLTLIGTPPNIVITNSLKQANFRPFGFFEFALIGLPLLLVGVGYMMLVGRNWLPNRETGELRSEKSTVPVTELAESYLLKDNLFQVRVRRGSGLAGRTLGDLDLRRQYHVSVLNMQHAGPEHRETLGEQAIHTLAEAFSQHEDEHPEELVPGPETTINVDDLLLVKGVPEAVHKLAVRFNLGLQPVDPAVTHPEADLLSNEVGLAEVVITPRSALIGQNLVAAHFAEKYNVQVLGIWRRGRSLVDERTSQVKLTFGDALLVRGMWKDINILERESRNFVVVGRPAKMVGQKALSAQAYVAIGALGVMLLLLLTGWVPTVMAVLITGLLMVLTGCLNMEQAYRSINWESVVLIAAMLPMSTALEQTGGAGFIANGLVEGLGTFHPLLLLTGIFLMTTAFTQVISNTATTVLVAPIALQAAANLGVSPYPIMMMVAVAASTAFLTPIASPVNTLVLTPGGYRFGDFMRSGLALLVLFLVVALLLVPLIWPM